MVGGVDQSWNRSGPQHRGRRAAPCSMIRPAARDATRLGWYANGPARRHHDSAQGDARSGEGREESASLSHDCHGSIRHASLSNGTRVVARPRPRGGPMNRSRTARSALLVLLLGLATCGRPGRVVDGPVHRGFGVALQRSQDGWVVRWVFRGSAAARAGLKQGDRLLAISGQGVDGRAAPDLLALIAAHGTGAVSVDLRGPSGAGRSVDLRPGEFVPWRVDGAESAEGDCDPMKVFPCDCPAGCEGNACGRACYLSDALNCVYDCGPVDAPCECFLIS